METPDPIDVARFRRFLEAYRIDRRAFLANGLKAGAAFGLGGLIAACTPGDGDGDDPGPTGDTAGGPLTPQPGGTLRVGMGDVVPADYFRGNTLGNQVFTYCQFAWPLFIQPDEGSEAAFALAESYDVSDDGLIHTATLREGITFHDGSPIDADAVVQNLRADFFEDSPLRDEGPYVAALLTFGFGAVMQEIEAVDQLTVQMTLTQPRPDIRRGLWFLYIMNPEILAKKNFGTDPGALRDAGSGPFRVTDFSPSSFVEFERFDGFFEDVWLDRLRIDNSQDVNALTLGLRSGEFDVGVALPKADFDSLTGGGDFQGLLGPRPALNIFFDINSPRFPEMEDVRVREAIILAMNRPAYREIFFPEGAALPGTQPVTVEGSPGYNPDLEERPYDPERARELLAEAGVEGMTLRAISTAAFGFLSNMRQLWDAVQSDLAAVGIDLEITITDSATAEAEWPENDLRPQIFDDEHEFLVFPIYYQLFNTDPETDPRALNPEVTRLLTAAQETADAAERDALLEELQQLEHDELIMGVPFTLMRKSAVARQGVHDLRVHFTADPLHKTWIEA